MSKVSPEVAHVADRIRNALHLYDLRFHGNYSVYIAQVAIKAVAEIGDGLPVEPAEKDPLADLLG